MEKELERWNVFLNDIGITQTDACRRMGYSQDNEIAQKIRISATKGKFPKNLSLLMNFVNSLEDTGFIVYNSDSLRSDISLVVKQLNNLKDKL